MSKAQYGTGEDFPVIQKLHQTEKSNFKIKLNRRAAKRLMKGDQVFMTQLRNRLTAAAARRRAS